MSYRCELRGRVRKTTNDKSKAMTLLTNDWADKIIENKGQGNVSNITATMCIEYVESLTDIPVFKSKNVMKHAGDEFTLKIKELRRASMRTRIS